MEGLKCSRQKQRRYLYIALQLWYAISRRTKEDSDIVQDKIYCLWELCKAKIITNNEYQKIASCNGCPICFLFLHSNQLCTSCFLYDSWKGESGRVHTGCKLWCNLVVEGSLHKRLRIILEIIRLIKEQMESLKMTEKEVAIVFNRAKNVFAKDFTYRDPPDLKVSFLCKDKEVCLMFISYTMMSREVTEVVGGKFRYECEKSVLDYVYTVMFNTVHEVQKQSFIDGVVFRYAPVKPYKFIWSEFSLLSVNV